MPITSGTLHVFRNGDLLLIVDNNGSKLALDSLEHKVLGTIRFALHSVRLGDIARKLGLALGDVYMVVEKLRNKGPIKTALERQYATRLSQSMLLHKP